MIYDIHIKKPACFIVGYHCFISSIVFLIKWCWDNDQSFLRVLLNKQTKKQKTPHQQQRKETFTQSTYLHLLKLFFFDISFMVFNSLLSLSLYLSLSPLPPKTTLLPLFLFSLMGFILKKIYCKGKPFPLVNIDHRDWKKGPRTITTMAQPRKFCCAKGREKKIKFNGAKSKKQQ